MSAFQCGSVGSLKAHLRSKHGIEFEDVQKDFPSVQLFEEWKSALENERFFNLVADQGEQVNGKGERRRILICNRSGECRGQRGQSKVLSTERANE